MDGRPAPWLLPVLGLVLLGSFFLGGRSAPAPDGGRSSDLPLEREGSAALDTTPEGKIDEAVSLIAERVDSGWNASYAVATLPDPVDSHVDYKFDRYVGAIQRAAEAARFVLDRFSFPWWPTEALSRERVAADRVFRTTPGFLLFRDASESRLLMVYLVGETPTAGVHEDAMLAALRRVPSTCVRILGPSFSGSEASLLKVLEDDGDEREDDGGEREDDGDECEDEDPQFDVFTGAATNLNTDEWGENGHWLQLKATVPHDEVTLPTFLAYLTDTLGVDAGRIALLSESNTGYGQAVVSAQGGPEEGESEQGESAEEESKSFVRLPYPLRISELRATRARRSTEEPARSDQPSALPLEDQALRVDVPPVVSPLNPHTLEVTLAKILSVIDREGYRYVGLFGTSIKDRLFLAREIRRHSPDVTLFTFGADLLYLNPGENGFLRGMLVATPYPLFGLNQVWTGSRRRIQFAGSNTQGVYNAMLALLDSSGLVEEREGEALLLEYQPPYFGESSTAKPPLWISVVGRDDLWPVTLRDVSRQPDAYMLDEEPPPEASRAFGDQAVLGFGLGLSAVTLLAVYLTLSRRRERGSPKRPTRDAWLFWPLLERPVYAENDLDWSTHLLATRGAVFVLYLQGAGIWLAAWTAGEPFRFWLWSAVLVVLTLFFAHGIATAARDALDDLSKVWWRPDTVPRRAADLFAGALVLLATLVLVIAGVIVVVSWWSQPTADRLFLYLRSVRLRSGVSILVPAALFTTVGFMWGYTMLARLRLMESLPSSFCQKVFDDTSLAGVGALERRIRDVLAYGFHAFPAWPVAFLIFSVGFAFVEGGLLFRPLSPTQAGAAYDGLLKLSLFFVNFILFITFFRLLWLSLELRQFLRRLSWHPILEAFSRLPRDVNWAPLTGWTGRLATFGGVQHALERGTGFLDALDEEDSGEVLPEHRAALVDARRNLARAQEHHAEGDWPQALEKRSDALADLAALAKPALARAETFWVAGGRTRDPEDGGASVPRAVRCAEDFLGSRFAIFAHSILAHLRNFATFVVVGLVLMLLAISSFPFQPRQLLLTYGWIVIAAVVGTLLVVLVEMDKDVVLSRMSGTVPGRLTWTREFVFRLAGYVALPLLSLLAAQFPDLGARIAEWLGSLVTTVPTGVFER